MARPQWLQTFPHLITPVQWAKLYFLFNGETLRIMALQEWCAPGLMSWQCSVAASPANIPLILGIFKTVFCFFVDACKHVPFTITQISSYYPSLWQTWITVEIQDMPILAGLLRYGNRLILVLLLGSVVCVNSIYMVMVLIFWSRIRPLLEYDELPAQLPTW